MYLKYKIEANKVLTHNYKIMLNKIWDDTDDVNSSQEDNNDEYEQFLQTCGSCSHFKPFMTESGLCKLRGNCICNTTALIDIWDDKCVQWSLAIEYQNPL